MDADQERHTADLSLKANSVITTTNMNLSHDSSFNSSSISQNQKESTEEGFRFLDLPIELRLKIYEYLLPARQHTIATQIPNNGYFYNTSTIPQHSAQSFYPFGTQSPRNPKLTTYKILTSNFRSNFPRPSIHPEILRVSKQVHDEAENVLYGSKDAIFDFRTHLDAAIAFFGDRSEAARKSVKCIRVAREIPAWLGRDAYGNQRRDETWIKFCNFVKHELKGLRSLDLTLWSSTGSAASFPTQIVGVQAADEIETRDEEEEERARKVQEEDDKRKWREWEYTASLLEAEDLRESKVTWWGFKSKEGNAVEQQDDDQEADTGDDLSWATSSNLKGFDSWIAARMVGDRLVRDRMVKDGVVVEGVVVIPGSGA
ncbi:hypothetical protein EG329_012843 [Mollisiaceae sp. DMI_Dod_QoI]|nr:hypothetical protein EG329_012843 [Helotiales sp. DMI_Dod_QoI]